MILIISENVYIFIYWFTYKSALTLPMPMEDKHSGWEITFHYKFWKPMEPDNFKDILKHTGA
jgi:hypothetical protein